jgi:AcrR family transcriptional regulator
LNERLLQATRELIVVAAVDELEARGLMALTNAGIADRAGVSERTVYRHFTTREQLMAALAPEVARRLQVPSVPDSPAELPAFVGALFQTFEAQPRLTREALLPELFVHLRDGQAGDRWRALRRLLDQHWPRLPADRRELAAANLRFLLTASSWHYHRTQLGLDADRTIATVAHAIACILEALGPGVELEPSAQR